VFSLQGRIWIEGGGACDYTHVYHDMWSTADGVTWTQSVTPAAWSARMWPCVATGPDGIVWLATGYAPSDWNNTNGVLVRYGANHADAWYSKNGSDWRQLKADFGSGLPDDGTLEPRHAPTCFVTGDATTGTHLLIVAGSGGRDPNGFNARVLKSIRSLSLPKAESLRETFGDPSDVDWESDDVKGVTCRRQRSSPGSRGRTELTSRSFCSKKDT